MLKTLPRAFTQADYFSLPESAPRYELIDGELIMAPAPNRKHQNILMNLSLILNTWAHETKSGKVYVAPFDVVLSNNNVHQPDMVYFSPDRLHCLTDQGAEGAPALTVEILSPSTAHYDRDVKREIYARTGVEELWIIDPATDTIQTYRLQENAVLPKATLRGKQSIQSPLFPGLIISLEAVFEK